MGNNDKMLKKPFLKNSTKQFIIVCAVSGALGISAISCLGGAVYNASKRDEKSNEVDNYGYHLLSTDNYGEYRDNKIKELTQMYRDGIITAKEYSKKVSALSTIDYLVDHKEESLTSAQADRLSKMEKSRDNYNDNTAGCVIGCGVSSVGLLISLLPKNKDKKRESNEEEMSL